MRLIVEDLLIKQWSLGGLESSGGDSEDEEVDYRSGGSSSVEVELPSMDEIKESFKQYRREHDLR